jgi:TDG/mug DNA glycosylase family protein
MPLPDILTPGLRAIICGTAVGERSDAVRHYYAGRNNDFWRLLHESGLTPRLLSPEEDVTLPDFGIGLTDLNKTVAQSHDRGLVWDVPGLVAKVARYRPGWVAFHGKTAARAVRKTTALGVQTWRLAEARVYVLPSASGAARGGPFAPLASRLDWWRELALRQNEDR